MIKKSWAVWKGGIKDGGGTISTETGFSRRHQVRRSEDQHQQDRRPVRGRETPARGDADLEDKKIRLWADKELRNDGDSLKDTRNAHLSRVKSGNYVALMAYGSTSVANHLLVVNPLQRTTLCQTTQLPS